ncbi:MAG: NTP transferase domain-containing protein [Flavisolibacter sp.]|jgi:NDP-sugar pyrophosphorylase family protein|nr:NTP transferase domain-containing protein [Flavisolibacter sp.]
MIQKSAQGANLRAIIFSAGLGTRLKPWTDQHPKALAVVNGKPLLQRNIEYLQRSGINEVVVNVHHFAGQVIDTLEKNNGWGSKIFISDEKEEVLETGGGLLKAKPFLENSRFISINVDMLTDADLGSMLAFHEQEKAMITLAVTNRHTARYLLFNKENQLCGWRNTDSFRERIVKPAAHYIEKAFSGIAVFEPAIFDHIHFEGKFSVIEIYLDLALKYHVTGFDHSGGKLIDVGKPENVIAAEKLFV